MSLFDIIQYPVLDDPTNPGWPQYHEIPLKFLRKWRRTFTPDHVSDTEFLREIILNWNETDEENYNSHTVSTKK